MSTAKPEVEWLLFPNSWTQYGVLCLAGKWAAVRAYDVFHDEDYEVITEWLPDRKTAIGFLKLLKEN